VFEPGIIGPFRRVLKGKGNYLNSFYWTDVEPGGFRGGVVCEDLMNLTMVDNTFDIVITSDIFEHIRKPMNAFREICRVLKFGGRHIFTVPAQEPLRKRTCARVDTSSDEDVFLMPEVYHGSGDGGRSLVYTDFGLDLLENLAAIGLATDCCWYGNASGPIPRVATFVSTKVT
jgi:SAM-dependent methyltransferase